MEVNQRCTGAIPRDCPVMPRFSPAATTAARKRSLPSHRLRLLRLLRLAHPVPVYRIRLALLKEHGGIDGYHAYLRETGPKWEAMGFRQSHK